MATKRLTDGLAVSAAVANSWPSQSQRDQKAADQRGWPEGFLKQQSGPDCKSTHLCGYPLCPSGNGLLHPYTLGDWQASCLQRSTLGSPGQLRVSRDGTHSAVTYAGNNATWKSRLCQRAEITCSPGSRPGGSVN
ncbi:unnamed protein product [Lepidochelys kempii]